MNPSAAGQLDYIKGTYAVLAAGFDFPRREFWAAVEGRTLHDLVAAGDVQNDGEHEFETAFPILTPEEREREYIDLFELGSLHPYEGTLVASAGREGILEELLRFYHFFDLKLCEGNRDHPDHITTELEFMSRLAWLEALAAVSGSAVVALQRAQRDFLSRHVLQWSEQLRRNADLRMHPSYFLLALWLHKFANWHKSYLDELDEAEISAQTTAQQLAGELT